jgi:hypothetical protein
MTIHQDRLDALDALILQSGGHASPEEGMCVTDADLQRFRSFIEIGRDPRVDCWIWTGYIWPNTGYARFYFNGRGVRAHKFSYELSHGPVSLGLHLDHTCHNTDAACPGGLACLHRRCVNPFHVEPVTPKENQHRSRHSPSHQNSLKTHCPAGHAYDEANTLVRANGIRECRACGREETRRYRSANLDLVNARKRARRAALRGLSS